jgi:uncharacterized protein (UPF0332 family)
MSFDWESYLLLAEHLNDAAQELEGDANQEDLREAYLRSALSRFYYGVFCIAKNVLDDYVPVPKKNIHKFVICEYTTSPDSQVSKVGENLKRLMHKRGQADYENEIDIRERDTYQSDFDAINATNKKARKLVQQIKMLKSDGSMSSLTFSEGRC